MSVDIESMEIHRVPREMLHDAPLVEGLEELDHFPVPAGEANHLLFTATTPESMVGVAVLDYVPGAWLGKVTVGLDPELNGHSMEVVDHMTAKLAPAASRLGMTVLKVVQRVKRQTGDGLGPIEENHPYGEKPLMQVGL